ncbi:MAG: single-stranded DNA-binding protein [Elusimicrobia bacterium]|nr:single-stranded DNA-binding protein [Elusimicrobiota bacterium]MDE2424561.1 single-stranded DNA-binding protein [Elusimicrobiota bacterium]
MAAGVRLPEINFVLLAGRVTRDAELFVTQSGLAKLTVRIAVNRRVKDAKTGEWKDDTFYIDCVAWKEMAERAKEKAKKGVAVVVEGRLTGRDYEKDGQKRTVFEVMANRLQFLSSTESSSESASPRARDESKGQTSGSAEIEEVPF